MSRIMVVDDEEMILKSMKRLLSRVPCIVNGDERKLVVDVFQDPVQALAQAKHTAYDLVISDYRMPHMDGVIFLSRFREIQPDTPRMILSGYADLNGLIQAINKAAICRFIAKPWNDYELLSTIGLQLHLHEVSQENQKLADASRVVSGDLSAEEFERRQLELAEPGITHVNWGPDGSVILDDDLS